MVVSEVERGRGGMMEARNVTVRFDGILVLDRVSLRVPGEGITYLSGPSGAGKTTLLRVLAGLLEPEAGEVLVRGRPVVLFQEDRLFPEQSARRQIEAVLPRQRRGEAARWLEFCELSEAADKLPVELSGGMARRLALGRALAVEGDIYLLDEPFAGVDLDRAKRILERLQGLQKPMVMTGHLPELARLCARTIAL